MEVNRTTQIEYKITLPKRPGESNRPYLSLLVYDDSVSRLEVEAMQKGLDDLVRGQSGQDAADAARYRWLKTQRDACSHADVDAAVDAAIAATRGGAGDG